MEKFYGRKFLLNKNVLFPTFAKNLLRIISLACVSSETPNLQRVFRPGWVVPYIGCIGMCRAKGFFF